MNNTATAAVMSPIAIGTAAGLGVSPDAFLMGVAIASSCAFNTPIGHQNNTLILGPGGFRFGDYWRMGLPLDLLVLAVSVPLLLVAFRCRASAGRDAPFLRCVRGRRYGGRLAEAGGGWFSPPAAGDTCPPPGACRERRRHRAVRGCRGRVGGKGMIAAPRP